MKTSVLFSGLLAVVSASNTKFNCTKPNANFCLGGDIILRCDGNSVGTPGRCSSNLAGYAPIGGPASCWESSAEAGDAACQKNCIVHADQPFTLPGCSPTFTAAVPNPTHPPQYNTTLATVVVPTTVPCKHCNSTQTPPPGTNPSPPGTNPPGSNPPSPPGSNPPGSNPPGSNPPSPPGSNPPGQNPPFPFPPTNGTNGPLPGTAHPTGWVPTPTGYPGNSGGSNGGNNGGNNGGSNGGSKGGDSNGNNSPTQATNIPVGPTTTAPGSLPTAAAPANKAQVMLAAAGVVLAYIL